MNIDYSMKRQKALFATVHIWPQTMYTDLKEGTGLVRELNPETSRTRSENHTPRPTSRWRQMEDGGEISQKSLFFRRKHHISTFDYNHAIWILDV